MTADLFGTGDVGDYKAPPRCHTTHKPLKLGNNGEILGGSCGSPRDGYDIYIGFDYGMKMQHQAFPWEQKGDAIIEFQYRITDMCAPKSPKQFKEMIDWCADQLDDGKKIHVGCIGGHGRTGTFLAALVSLYEDLTDDPIKWVRENHCKKAVESKSQIKFLMKHFGCKKAKPTKEWGGAVTGTQTGRFTSKHSNHPKGEITQFPGYNLPEKLTHMPKKGSIWG